MAAPDLNNLRTLLDEHERYALSMKAPVGSSGVAADILAAVLEARAALHPSADSTANFIDVKEVVERLAQLRARAEASR